MSLDVDALENRPWLALPDHVSALIQRLREAEARQFLAGHGRGRATARIERLERVREAAQALVEFDREHGLLAEFIGSWAVHPPALDQAETLFAELRAALVAAGIEK